MSGRRRVSYIGLFLLILVGVLVAILVMSRVHDSLTTEDRHYIAVILGPTALVIDGQEPSHFGEQLVLIQRIQAAVLQTATKDVGIPLGHPREPKSVYMAGHGLCYDRSRVIEKALRYDSTYFHLLQDDELSKGLIHASRFFARHYRGENSERLVGGRFERSLDLVGQIRPTYID